MGLAKNTESTSTETAVATVAMSWAKVAAIVLPIIVSAVAIIWKMGAEAQATETRFQALEARADKADVLWANYSPFEKMFVGAAAGIKEQRDRVDKLTEETRRELARMDRNHAVTEQLFRSIDVRLSNIEKSLERRGLSGP